MLPKSILFVANHESDALHVCGIYANLRKIWYYNSNITISTTKYHQKERATVATELLIDETSKSSIIKEKTSSEEKPSTHSIV